MGSKGVGKLSSSQGYYFSRLSIRDGQNPCGQTRLVRRASAVLGLVGGLQSREARACGSRRWSLEFGVGAEVCRKFGTWDQNSGDLLYSVLIAIAIAFVSSVNCSVSATPSILIEESSSRCRKPLERCGSPLYLAAPFLPLWLRSNIHMYRHV